jgi:signal transduction histidine kinase
VQVCIGLVQGSNLAVTVIFDGLQAKGGKGAETIFKIDKQSATGQVLQESRAAVLNNVTSQRLYGTAAETTATVTNSLMLAPLITAAKTIGLIIVQSARSNAFDESDLETLETLAFQIASAVEYARLLRKTRKLAIVDERTRLARDMHDGVAQNLAYLLLQVDRCLNMVEEGSKLETQLDQIGLLLEQNIDELRRNIFDLRPMALEGKSLFDVLENFVAEFGRRWSLQTTCSINGSAANVPARVESSVYRILQETFANVRQHADCTWVAVTLTVRDDAWLTLEITDDGRGFDVNQPYQNRTQEQRQGLGLISIRERVENIGGHLTIKSVPGEGTRIFAELPLHQSPDLEG